MSGISSFLMALMLLFNAGFGDAPVYSEVRLHVEDDGLITAAFEEEAAVSGGQVMGLISDLADVLSFRSVQDNGTVQYDIYAGGSPLVSFGMRYGEDGLAAASSLLGSHVLTFTPEAMGQIGPVPGTYIAVNEVSRRKGEIFAEAMRIMDGIVDRVRAGAGTFEPGSYEVDGHVFTGRAALCMTVMEFSAIVRDGMKEFLQFGPVADLIAAVDQDGDVITPDEDVEEDLFGDMEGWILSVYTSAEGSFYVALDRTDDDGYGTVRTHLGFGSVDGRRNIGYLNGYSFLFDTWSYNGSTECNVSFVSDSDFHVSYADRNECIFDGQSDSRITRYTADSTADGTYSSDLVIKNTQGDSSDIGIDYRYDTTFDRDENPYSAVVSVSLNGRSVTMDLSGAWGKGGGITLVFDGEDVQIIPADAILLGGDASRGLQEKIVGIALPGLMKALSDLAGSLPDDSAAFLTGLIRGE